MQNNAVNDICQTKTQLPGSMVSVCTADLRQTVCAPVISATVAPCSAAAWRSMWSEPTPAVRISFSLGAFLSSSSARSRSARVGVHDTDDTNSVCVVFIRMQCHVTCRTVCIYISRLLGALTGDIGGVEGLQYIGKGTEGHRL
jgi:hypothetical protein